MLLQILLLTIFLKTKKQISSGKNALIKNFPPKKQLEKQKAFLFPSKTKPSRLDSQMLFSEKF